MSLNQNRNLDYWKSMFPELSSHLNDLERDIQKQKEKNEELRNMLNTQVQENKALTKHQENLELQNKTLRASLSDYKAQIDNLTRELNKATVIPVRLSDNEIWHEWHTFCDRRKDWHVPLYDSANYEMYYAAKLTAPKYLDDFIVYLSSKLAKENKVDKTINKKELEKRLINLSFGALGN